MRKRKPKSTDVEKIEELGIKWRKKVHELEFDEAIAIRKEADPLLKKHPDIKRKPPSRFKKTLYIDWDFFIDYLDEKAQTEYNYWAKKAKIRDRNHG